MYHVNLVLHSNQLLERSPKGVIGKVGNNLYTTLCGNVHHHEKMDTIREMITQNKVY